MILGCKNRTSTQSVQFSSHSSDFCSFQPPGGLLSVRRASLLVWIQLGTVESSISIEFSSLRSARVHLSPELLSLDFDRGLQFDLFFSFSFLFFFVFCLMKRQVVWLYGQTTELL